MARRTIPEEATPSQSEPTSSIEDTQEFKQAVKNAVSEATESITRDILARLSSMQPPGHHGVSPSDQSFAEGLALAIASLTDQGPGRQPVPPQILRQRAEARQKMMDLILQAREEGLSPVYTLRNKVYLDEQLIEPIWIDPQSKEQRATEIEWRSVPSDAMKPVNEIAKKIHQAFLDSIGSIEQDNERPLLGVTAGGLVIRSGSAAVRQPTVLRGNDPSNAPLANPNDGGLRVPHKERGGQYVERRVLGTVAPPARQTA